MRRLKHFLFGGSTPTPIWEFRPDLQDLTTSPASITALQAYLTSIGMTYTRSGVATVQTSASTIYTSFSANQPRNGYTPRAPKAFYLDQSRRNLLTYTDDFNNSNWVPWGSGGGAAPTDNGASGNGPNGTTTARSYSFPAVVTGESVVFQGAACTGGPYTVSVWMKGAVGGEEIYLILGDGTDTVLYSTLCTLTTEWQRFSVTGTTDVANWYFEIGCNLNDPTQSPTSACTIIVADAQFESGADPSSYIVTAGTAMTRSAERLQVDAFSRLCDGAGRLRMELCLVPFEDRSNYAAGGSYLLKGTASANNKSLFIPGTGVLQLTAGGTLVASSNGPVDWSAIDLLRIYFEMGAGVAYAKGQVNGGAIASWTFPGTVQPSITLAEVVDLLQNAGTSATAAGIVYAKAYDQRPPEWS